MGKTTAKFLKPDFENRIAQSREERLFKKIEKRAAYRIKTLSNKQKLAIHLLTDFNHNYSQKTIAKILDISPANISIWKRDPLFLKALNIQIDQLRTLPRIDAYRHLFSWVRAGNYKAIKDYLKMIGDLKETVVNEDNRGKAQNEDELDRDIKELMKDLDIEVESEL